MTLAPKPPSASATEMVEVVLPNDANPMGFMLGGAVMHLIDISTPSRSVTSSS
jgi:acyl-CoA hydrolase